jgi:signal transduction histidine kinase
LELSLSVAPITDASGRQTSVIAVFRDVSREKELERQRSEFVSTASHEMRTPVASIEGYISLALNSKVATVDDRARNYLTKAHENTQHLGALFRDLLSVTKVEEGIASHHLVPVNISQMLEEVIGDMQLAAQKKNLKITYGAQNAGGDRSVMPIYYVLAEPERLREVITNLIDNAIKYTQSGGVTVGLGADQKLVTVRVTDTGAGIAPEHIPHLFQKFYRVDNSATRTAGGTGLGLYLCRAIIEQFSGRIWVESQLGKGSSFNFSLVRTEPAEEAAPVPQTVPAKPAPTLEPRIVTPAASLITRPATAPAKPGRIDGIARAVPPK